MGLIYKYTRSLRSLLSKKFGDFSHHYIFNGQTVSIRGTVKGELLLILLDFPIFSSHTMPRERCCLSLLVKWRNLTMVNYKANC